MGKLRMFALVGVLALVAAACSKNTTTPTSSGTTPTASSTSSSTPSTEPITKKGTKDVTSGAQFAVQASNDGTTSYFFDPTFLKAKPGERITVVLENKGTFLHNFTISSLNVNQDLAVGKSITITFTLPSSGDIEFHCEYHHASGMRGYFFFGSSPPQASGATSTSGGTTTGPTTY